MTDVTPAEQLAIYFHDRYEKLAPQHGYETREASRKPWSEVPENNRSLMIAVCAEILQCDLFDAILGKTVRQNEHYRESEIRRSTWMQTWKDRFEVSYNDSFDKVMEIAWDLFQARTREILSPEISPESTDKTVGGLRELHKKIIFQRSPLDGRPFKESYLNIHELGVLLSGAIELERRVSEVKQLRRELNESWKIIARTHDLVKDEDPPETKPEAILDPNGEVVLGLCRHCGAAEAQLGERVCTGPKGVV